jgi:pantoate--beta-alanine ligase
MKKSSQVSTFVRSKQDKGVKIGMVPTMGALHDGHLQLLRACRREALYSVCSIFVNPTQFNDKKDFQQYPVTLEKDIYLLEQIGVDLLFLPGVEDVYPGGSSDLEHYDLGFLETVLEGYYRPGHFQGVCQVMRRLLDIIRPDKLFMGQKDYQQCMVVRKLLGLMHAGIELEVYPTQRENDGLAMSSRNVRLDQTGRKKALAIYESLRFIQEHIKPGPLKPLLEEAAGILTRNDFRIDYLVVANSDTLEPVGNWNGSEKILALAAAFQQQVRLIDNILLN